MRHSLTRAPGALAAPRLAVPPPAPLLAARPFSTRRAILDVDGGAGGGPPRAPFPVPRALPSFPSSGARPKPHLLRSGAPGPNTALPRRGEAAPRAVAEDWPARRAGAAPEMQQAAGRAKRQQSYRPPRPDRAAAGMRTGEALPLDAAGGTVGDSAADFPPSRGRGPPCQ